MKSANWMNLESVSQASPDEESSEPGSDTGSEVDSTLQAPDLSVKAHTPKSDEVKSKQKQGDGGGSEAAPTSVVVPTVVVVDGDDGLFAELWQQGGGVVISVFDWLRRFEEWLVFEAVSDDR